MRPHSFAPLALLASGCLMVEPDTPLPVDVEERSAAIVEDVSRLRALPLREEVPARVLEGDAVREAVRQLVDRDWTEHASATERAYQHFGLLPASYDLRRDLVDLMAALILGYYDPHDRRFTLVQTGRVPEQDFAIAHELVHALQDQHFDLKALQEARKTDNEASAGLSALVEGDAILGALDHLYWVNGLPLTSASPAGRRVIAMAAADRGTGRDSGDPAQQALEAAPPVLRAELLFPYTAGSRLAAAIRAEFGQAGLDASYADPPQSTEQVLYPERYLDRRDFPQTLHLPEPPAGWTARFEETLGMLTVRAMLREGAGRFAARVASGWDGDRYALWQGQGETGEALVWVSVWERPWHAWRFARTYRGIVARRRGDDRFAVVRHGNVVAAFEGAEPEVCEAIAERLLSSRVERHPSDPRPHLLPRWLPIWLAGFSGFDRVAELRLVGGSALRLRWHGGGHQLGLLRGLLLRSERTPDRRHLSTAAGLLYYSSEPAQGLRATLVPFVVGLHSRHGPKGARRTFALVPAGITSALSVGTAPGGTRIALLSGLLLRVEIGAAHPRGERVRVLFLPVPGL